MPIGASRLEALVVPVVESLGYEFWGLEYRPQPRQSLLRVYIEARAKPAAADDVQEKVKVGGEEVVPSEGGINVDDCARVSRQLSGVLDVEDPISGKYQLEVSSPGMSRMLFTLAHFEQFVGEVVKIKLNGSFEGRKNFTGRLTAVKGNDVCILVDDYEYEMPYEQIDKANVVPEFA